MNIRDSRMISGAGCAASDGPSRRILLLLEKPKDEEKKKASTSQFATNMLSIRQDSGEQCPQTELPTRNTPKHSP